MRKNIVAGNWKMNTTLEEGVELANQINTLLKGKKVNCDVICCVPFTHLTSVNAVLEPEVVALGAENCSEHEKGAYTGEVSAAMVKSTGAQYVILGHSERRQYFGENNEQAQDMNAHIRKVIEEKYGKEVAENTSILYGGSCKPTNAKEIFAKPDVDGGLIGGAALKADSFMGIIEGFDA